MVVSNIYGLQMYSKINFIWAYIFLFTSYLKQNVIKHKFTKQLSNWKYYFKDKIKETVSCTYNKKDI